ncbi:hypothetical protein [Rhizobacter sp. Root1221]|uniref:hypothetical protein n=1 Tax=Rhizobacter sp. Root1221 TaxID=1736433 RepID=UPI0009E93B3A|nr:hypothetical protein [Rhizobacter sp. Root1221]
MQAPRESLYSLLPAVIRQRDQNAEKALEQLLAIIDEQAVQIERDFERMYDNWFIETCDDWVVPYIGDLLGYELPPGVLASGAGSAALERVLAPRREVGNLIAQRRRKGTAVVLEALARDIANWPARAVEYYQRLVVAQHLDHLRPERAATIDLRGQSALLRADSPFDASCAIVDVRRIGSAQSRGRFNITNVGLHVYRLRRYPVTRTEAYCREDQGLHCYTFSVLGNDAPLFRLPQPAAETAQPTGLQQVPLPIGRFELEADDTLVHADPRLFGIDGSLSLSVPDWPKKGAGGHIAAAAIIPADLSRWSCAVPKGRIAVDPVLGRIMFPSRQAPGSGVIVSYGYGFAMDLGGGEYQRALPPMPAALELAVTRADDMTPSPGEFATIAQAVSDWQSRRALPADKRAAPALLVELVDSGVYRGSLHLALQPGESVWIVSASGKRPVLWLGDFRAGGADAISVRGLRGSRFTLDGVLVAGRGINISPLPSDDPQSTAPADDDLCQVLIRHSTLVPGWGLQHDCEPQRPSEPSIVLNGSRTCLRIEHSIVGAIRVMSDGAGPERARVAIEDSIVDATSVSRIAIGGPGGEGAAADLCVARSTLVGETLVHAITRADNSLFVGHVSVARRQVGCMRYCYVPQGSRTPRRHRCQPETAIAAVDEQLASDATLDRSALRADTLLRAQPSFTSTRYGTPDYLRLHARCAVEIWQGADDASEMGVYHDLFEPQRIAVLEARLADAVPAGVDASVLLET